MIKVFLVGYVLMGLKMVWDYGGVKAHASFLELFLMWLTGPGMFLWMYVTHTFKIFGGLLDGSWVKYYKED